MPGRGTELKPVGSAQCKNGTASVSASEKPKKQVRGRGGPRKQAGDGDPMQPGATSELAKSMKALSLYQAVKRPAFLTIGEKIELLTNWVRFSFGSGKPLVVNHYSVDITCSTIRRIGRERLGYVFWQCVDRNRDIFQHLDRIIYDDGTLLFTLDELPLPINKHWKYEFRCKFPRDDRTNFCSVEVFYQKHFVVDIASNTVPALEQRSSRSTQLLDLILSQNRRCPLQSISKYWFGLNSRIYKVPEKGRGQALTDGLEVWQGLFTATAPDQHLQSILNVDVIHALFYKDQTLAEYAMEIIGRRKEDWQRQLTELEQNRFLRAICGLKFQTTHIKYGKRVRRARSLGTAPVNNFFIQEMPDGCKKRISVEDYFFSEYGIRLQYPHFPTICVNDRKMPAFPLEVCRLDRPQRPAFACSDRVKAAMIEKTRLNPTERIEKIKNMVNEANLVPEQDPLIRNFGINIDFRLIELTGRVIDPPLLLVKESKEDRSCEANMMRYKGISSGEWKTDGKRFPQPATCTGYGFIIIREAMLRLNKEGFKEFCYHLVLACRSRGMHFDTGVGQENTQPCEGAVQIIEDYPQLKDAFTQIKCQCEKFSNNKLQLIFVCVAQKDNACYARVKALGDTEFGVPTQVIQANTVEKILRHERTSRGERPNTTLYQLVLKVNAKLGGVNIKTDSRNDPVWKRLTSEESATLFLGIDVTHPEKTDIYSPSIGAVVGNIDLECNRYDVSFRVQKRCQESMIHFTKQLKERLLAFYKNIGVKPRHIIVLRDGISDSQFAQALDEEVGCMERACKDMDFQPKITYIVVQKRHHTRFFPQRNAVSGRTGNVPPGTTVDNTITHAHDFDFYLCSHNAAVGTAKPAHYVVLLNEVDLSVNDLISTIFRLCHHTARCNKSISMPAPTFYADLCCTRANHYVKNYQREHKESGESSTDRIFEDKTEEELENILAVNEKLKTADQAMYWI